MYAERVGVAYVQNAEMVPRNLRRSHYLVGLPAQRVADKPGASSYSTGGSCWSSPWTARAASILVASVQRAFDLPEPTALHLPYVVSPWICSCGCACGPTVRLVLAGYSS
jgi:hypothetical protein